MKAALTLVNIYEEDSQKVGFRAVDLARINQNRFPVPLTFVIPCQVFDEFITQSGIGVRLPKIYSKVTMDTEGLAQAYAEIKTLFARVNFSASIKDMLHEAYESLAIPPDSTDMSKLVAAEEDPRVTLLPSPTYLRAHEGLEGYLQNIHGKEAFLEAVKEVWLSLFLPEAVQERLQAQINSFSTGIIVQQQIKGRSAQSSYRQNHEIPIKVASYQGLPDKAGAVAKDEHYIQVEHLKIERSIIKQQPYKLVASETSGELEEVYLQEHGNEQKLTDKQVLEVARLTKRIHILLGTDLSFQFSVKDETASVLFVLRLGSEHTQTTKQELSVAERLKPELAEDESEASLDEPYDPDQEDLGLGPSGSLPEPDDRMVDPSVLDEIEAEENPVIIVDEEAPKIESYGEDDEPLPTEQTEAVESFPEPLREPATTEEVHESLGIELEDDEPLIATETPTPQAPDTSDQEETLFDLFTADEATPQDAIIDEQGGLEESEPAPQADPQHSYESSSSDDLTFIKDVWTRLYQQLETLHQEHYGRPADNDEVLLDNLEEAGALHFSKTDILFLKDYAQGDEEPEDHVIGLAWRINKTITR